VVVNFVFILLTTEERNMFPIIESEDGFQTVVNNKPYNVPSDHASFDDLKEAVREEDAETFEALHSVEGQVNNVFEGTDLQIEDGQLFYKSESEALSGTLVDRVLDYVDQGVPEAGPFVNFLDNLLENPSDRAVNELYEFLEHSGIPITDDGCFLAYKTVRNNYHDVFSNTFDNSVGEVIEMRRSKVDSDKNRTCSQGFHVGSWSYAGPDGWYHSNGNRVMVVKVNPRDAVSVPADHGASKLRVCKYKVVDELDTSSGEMLNDSYEGNMKCERDCSCDDEDESVNRIQKPSSSQMEGAVIHFANAMKKREPAKPWQVANELTDISNQHNVDRADMREAASMLYDGCDRNEGTFCDDVSMAPYKFGVKLAENM